MIAKKFVKNPSQVTAVEMMGKYPEFLAEGGSRSGKSLIIIYSIIIRAIKYPNSRHLCVRKRFNHAKQSLWYQTFPDVFRLAFKGLKVEQNKTDWFFSFPNGSQIWIGGTDDKERVEKLLGQEWATIYMNEASQFDFNTYETLKTRLNPPQGVRALLLIDYNPPSTNHWGYKIFHLGINPETKQPIDNPQRYGFIKMNPIDNIDNLSPEYMANLASMSESKRRRFERGEYSDDTVGALWKREFITKNRIKEMPSDILSCVVAVDPNVSEDKKNDHDDAGIIIASKYMIDGRAHYVVQDDRTVQDLTWGEEAVKAYREYVSDRIIGEMNQGGDLVAKQIMQYGEDVRFAGIRATRGKELRAEPVADLYRNGYVHHLGEDHLEELELEMISWVPGQGRSPNRVDALVYAISYLSGNHVGEVFKFYDEQSSTLLKNFDPASLVADAPQIDAQSFLAGIPRGF